MPVSKNRKGYAKKANLRKTRMAERRNRLNRIYREMGEALRSKHTSVPDMLNTEEKQTVIDAPELVEPVSIVSQWQDLTPEQQEIIDSAVITVSE